MPQVKIPQTEVSKDNLKIKGGRPAKAIKRSISLIVRLTPTEKLLIESRAKQAGLPTSEWLRRAAKSARIVPRLTPGQLQHFKTLSGLANNINQLTKLAHTAGLLSLAGQCRAMFREVLEVLNQLHSDGGQGDHR